MSPKLNSNSPRDRIFNSKFRETDFHNTSKNNTNTETIKFPSNPDYSGPGLWFVIHLTAIYATTPQSISDYIRQIKLMINNHPCGDCRKHATKYLTIDPPENYVDMKRNDTMIGMFVWSWQFHNVVNTRLDKPIIDFDTAYNMYQSSNIPSCHESCGKNNNNSDQNLISSISDLNNEKIQVSYYN